MPALMNRIDAPHPWESEYLIPGLPTNVKREGRRSKANFSRRQLRCDIVPREHFHRRDSCAVILRRGGESLADAVVVARLIVEDVRPSLFQKTRRHDWQSAVGVLKHLQAIG